jgi:hypothetical protein
LLQILLVFESTIDGQDDVEFCSLGRGQKLTILKSSKTSVSGCLTIMSRKVLSQSLAHALIEQNPHSYLGGQELSSLLQRGYGHLARNGWVIHKELFERVPSLQRVKEQLKGHARPAKHRRSTQNLRIFDYDAIHGTFDLLHWGEYTTGARYGAFSGLLDESETPQVVVLPAGVVNHCPKRSDRKCVVQRMIGNDHATAIAVPIDSMTASDPLENKPVSF